MPVPTWSIGQVLSAADVNNWFIPLPAVKTTDQSVTTSTVMVNDAQLLLPVAANVTYAFDCYLNFEGSSTTGQGIQWQIAVPASATLRYHATYTRASDGGKITGDTYAGANVVAALGQGAGNPCGAKMSGSLVTLATTGNIQVQWAQAASSGTSTVVRAQSFMMLRRIA